MGNQSDQMRGRLVVVTNRRLCHGDFLQQIERLCEGGADRIILREKDMSESSYEQLAREVMAICEAHHTECILHTYLSVAERLDADGIHLPLPVANQPRFRQLGISVHSLEDAVCAERMGATYLTAGHIFATDCKPDLAPRGLSFLAQVVHAVHIPVYAIGGINPQNAHEVLGQGAAGICVMSGLMNATTEQVAEYRNSTSLGNVE